jgi:carboxymethylenebutenolidase
MQTLGCVSRLIAHHPGTVHGFAARPALSVPEVKEAFEKAQDQTTDWFSKTLTV